MCSAIVNSEYTVNTLVFTYSQISPSYTHTHTPDHKKIDRFLSLFVSMNYILTTDTNFSFLFAVVWWRKMQKRQNVKHRLQIPHTSCLDLILRVSSFQLFCTPRKAPGWTWWYSRYVAGRGGVGCAWWSLKLWSPLLLPFLPSWVSVVLQIHTMKIVFCTCTQLLKPVYNGVSNLWAASSCSRHSQSRWT